jgi:hypothetical protein
MEANTMTHARWGKSLLSERDSLGVLERPHPWSNVVVDEPFIPEPVPLPGSARDTCLRCGHKRSRHIDGAFDCCQIVRRMVNVAADLAPIEEERSVVCDCPAFKK